MVFLNLRLNVHFCPSTSQIINFQYLTIYESQFWCQTLFFLFFVSSLGDERENGLILIIKRESLGWNRFWPWKRVVWCQWVPSNEKYLHNVFFPLNLSEMVDLNSKSFFVSSWLWVLEPISRLLKNMNMF